MGTEQWVLWKEEKLERYEYPRRDAEGHEEVTRYQIVIEQSIHYSSRIGFVKPTTCSP